MSQNEERARAVKQARKLMEMTRCNGAAEAEANTAMDRLDKIRKTFDLTLDEIVVASLEYQKKSVEHTAIKGCPMKSVIVGIGEFTDTKVWNMSNAGTYQFFGIDSDVDMAVYLYEVISEALAESVASFMKSKDYLAPGPRGCKRRRLVSFRKGFSRRVYFRLVELAAVRVREMGDRIEAGESDIVFIKSNERDRKYQEQIGIKLIERRNTTRGITDFNSATVGTQSANNINFNRPINGSTTSDVKLIGAS